MQRTSGALKLKTNGFIFLFLTREFRACARASSRYDVENGTRSLARSLARLVDPCKHFFDFRLLSVFDSFWRVINKQNGNLCC